MNYSRSSTLCHAILGPQLGKKRSHKIEASIKAHRSSEVVGMTLVWIPLHGTNVPFALAGNLAVAFGWHI